MHVHLRSESALVTFVANGITTVRNMSGDSSHLTMRRRVAAGDLLGPAILTAGPVIEGTPPTMPGMFILMDPRQARGEVTAQHGQGYDFIKVYNNVPGAVYDSIVAVARELNMPVAGHVPFEVGLRGALAARQASIEHLRGYVAELVPASAPVQPGPSLRSRSVVWKYAKTSPMAGLALATREAGVWNCPTLVVTPHNLLPSAENARLLARPEVRYLGLTEVTDRSRVPFLRDFADSDYAAAQQGLQAQLDLVRALHRAGAGLLAGTDSWLQGFALQDELELLARAGLTPYQVLGIATRAAAEFLGQGREWGTIAVGRRADLQLLEGNPLESLANLNRRPGVMLRGHWLARAELERRLEALVTPRPKAPSGT